MYENIQILLVEDVKIAQRIALIALQSLGCKIDTANTGTEALELFSKNRYDIVLLDIGLPDIDGCCVAKKMLQDYDNQHKAEIIILTAHSDDNYKQQCRAIGVTHFWVKPLTLDMVHTFIEKHPHLASMSIKG